MQDTDRERVAAWITRMKGDRTGADFAKDVRDVTGWSVDRSRLSKYGNASIHIGREVIGHLSKYAERKGFEPLDLRTPEPELPSLELALRTLVHELTTARQERDDLRRDVERLKATVNRLVAGTLAPADTPALGAPRVPHANAGSGR